MWERRIGDMDHVQYRGKGGVPGGHQYSMAKRKQRSSPALIAANMVTGYQMVFWLNSKTV